MTFFSMLDIIDLNEQLSMKIEFSRYHVTLIYNAV